MAPKVSIVIVLWNSQAHIPTCLNCIAAQTFRDYEVIAVDNHSSDDACAYLGRHYPELKIIRNQENVGFAPASNQGIRAAQGEFILILNPDVYCEPDFLAELVRCLSQNPGYGTVGGKLLLFKDGQKSDTIDSTGLFLDRHFRARDRGNLERDQGQYDQAGQVFAVCGAAVLFRREALEQAKIEGEYFAEDFFAYYEDLDLGWRIRLSGYNNGYTPRAVAFHVRGGSGSGGKFSQRSRALQKITLRNRYFMLIRNLCGVNLLFFLPFFFLTEISLLGYIFLWSPRLVGVYADVGRNLPKLLRKRALVQGSRRTKSRSIRDWIRMAP